MQETSFDTGMHDSVRMFHWCTTYMYMNGRCVLECRDTPTSHYNPYFHTYGNNLIPTQMYIRPDSSHSQATKTELKTPIIYVCILQ